MDMKKSRVPAIEYIRGVSMLGVVGITEYLVQRHGDWYLSCYGAMGLACVLMAGAVYRMYLSCCERD